MLSILSKIKLNLRKPLLSTHALPKDMSNLKNILEDFKNLDSNLNIPSLSAVSWGLDFNVNIFRSLQLAETTIPSNDWKTAPLNISLVNATKSMHRLHH